MNYLAHLFLGQKSDLDMLGNFIGDFVKGNNYNDYGFEVKRGILTHRRIDFFTDTHPDISKQKALLSGRYGHYAGVVIDVMNDYFLIKNWDLFIDIPLDVFKLKSYDTLLDYQDTMPFSAQIVLKYMLKNDWIERYKSVEGMNETFQAMSKHLKNADNMASATESLVEYESELNQLFLSFFPQLCKHIEEFLQSYNNEIE